MAPQKNYSTRSRGSDNVCWENDEFYEILVCSETFSDVLRISNVFVRSLVTKLMAATFLWAKCRGFVVFSSMFSNWALRVRFAKYHKASTDIRVVFLTRAVRLPSSATCPCTKSRRLPRTADDRFRVCANDPVVYFGRIGGGLLERVQTRRAPIKNVFDKSNWWFFFSTLLEMTTGAPHVLSRQSLYDYTLSLPFV